MKMLRIAAVAALLLAAAALAGAARPDAAEGVAAADDPGGITVNGTGAVATTPDVAEGGFGVGGQAPTARAALAANAADARKVVAALRAAGVAAADIQTQQAVLEPRYS